MNQNFPNNTNKNQTKRANFTPRNGSTQNSFPPPSAIQNLYPPQQFHRFNEPPPPHFTRPQFIPPQFMPFQQFSPCQQQGLFNRPPPPINFQNMTPYSRTIDPANK